MHIFNKIVDFCAVLSAVILLFMTVILCFDVASRFFLGFGIGWSLEVVEYGLLWFTLLAGAWVLRNDRHVKVDILLYRFSSKTRNKINIITSWFTAIAFIVITIGSFDLVLDYIHSGEKITYNFNAVQSNSFFYYSNWFFIAINTAYI